MDNSKKGNNSNRKVANNRISVEGIVPPQAVDIEEVVLGAIMLESSCLNLIVSDLSFELFYKEQNGLICEAILQLFSSNDAVDIMTVTQQLKKNGNLERVGGAYYVTTLTNRVASSAHVEFHLRILQQKNLERNLLKLSYETINRVSSGSEDVFDVYAGVINNVDNAMNAISKREISKVDDISDKLIVESVRVLNTGEKSGVPTGLREVDLITNGWQKTDLIIIAGRPAMGKTSVAICFAIKPAVELNKAVLVFSLEMSKAQLVGRIQSYYSEIDVSRIVKKQLSFDEIQHVESASRILKGKPLFIDDTPALSVFELKAKSRRMKREHDIELIVVDYLQLMRSGLNLNSREQEVAEISKSLKALAKELDIPVIALSQLSRKVEDRSDKKPLLSDLRESGSIEQDADMVIFTYRPDYYGIETYSIGGFDMPSQDLMMLLIEKHRNGTIGEVPLTFQGKYTRVINHVPPTIHIPQAISGKQDEIKKDNNKLEDDESPVVVSQGALTANTAFFNEKKTDEDAPF
jgi:replicative DNA helicase